MLPAEHNSTISQDLISLLFYVTFANRTCDLTLDVHTFIEIWFMVSLLLAGRKNGLAKFQLHKLHGMGDSSQDVWINQYASRNILHALTLSIINFECRVVRS